MRSIASILRWVILLVWMISLVAPLAQGQAQPETPLQVYFPLGKPPEEPLLYRNGGEMRLAVVLRGAVMIHRPDHEGKPLPIGQPRYLDPLVAYTQTSDEQYYLVKNPRTEDWGWIAKEFVLDANEPLRDEDPSNPAFLKVVVRNNWRTETGHLIQAAPILNGPGPEYDKMGQVNIFRIRYAYSIRTATNGNEYVLVGRDPDLHPEVPGNTLDGWIPREYVILWPSRVAVYYNKDNLPQRHEPAVFFHNQAHLKSYLETGHSQYAVGREDLRVLKGIRYDTTRFPVLDQSDDHLKVAFIGEAINHSTQGHVSNEEISQHKSTLNKAINQTLNRDVFFLIDATQSMEPYFQAVRNGIKRYMDRVQSQQRQEGERFRFALGIYRDYPDDNQGFHLLADFNAGYHAILQALDHVDAYSIPEDLNFPEALFQGIILSVRQAQWGEGRTRALVIIGDHGNHEQDQFAEQDVSRLLEANNISLYSINVNRQGQPPQMLWYNRLFEQQLKSILSLSGDVGENFALKSADQNEIDQTEEAIDKLLSQIFTFSQSVGNALQMKTEGKTTKEVESIYGTQVTTYMQRIMKEHGLSDEAINLALFSQLCIEGWVSKQSRNQDNQLEPWVLIDRTSMDEFLGIIAGIHSRAKRYVAEGLGKSVQAVIERASGDSIKEGELISEYLQRRYHLPYKNISSVLQYTPYQLEEKFAKGTEFKKRFVKDLGQKYAFLQSVVEEKEIELQWDEEKIEWRRLNAKKKERWWETGLGGRSFAWLPMDYLP